MPPDPTELSIDAAASVWDALGERLEAFATAWESGTVPDPAAFLPDGRQFVAGALDGSVRVWDAASGEAASLLGWHDAEIRAVAISADGRWAVSGSADGSVFVWEIASGRIAHAWSEPGHPITSVAFSPDGGRIAIASGGWQHVSGEITLLEKTKE